MTSVERAKRIPALSSLEQILASLGAWPRTVVGALLVLVTFGPAYATLLAAASATFQPIALDYGEPIVYYDALRINHGQPLYQPLDAPPYTIAAYTPLYYLVAAEIGVLAGPGFGPG